MDLAMEVGAHSRWASDLLSRCGHRVVVADPRQIGLITKSHAKSDKRDARTLAQLLRADARLLSPLEHRAENLQMDLTVIRMRDNLIETRTRLVTSVRGEESRRLTQVKGVGTLTALDVHADSGR